MGLPRMFRPLRHILASILIVRIDTGVEENFGGRSFCVLEFHLLQTVHLVGSALDHISLLPDTQALHIVEADAHQRVQVGRVPARRMHVQPRGVVVPELLVVLLVFWQCTHVRSLLEGGLAAAPAALPPVWLMLVRRGVVDGLSQIPAMSQVALRCQVVLSCNAFDGWSDRERGER